MSMNDFRKLWLPDSANPNWVIRGFNNYRTPLAMRKGTEVYPGVYSFDEVTIEFVRELSSMLNSDPALQPSVDENQMVGTNGVHTTFDRLRTVAGYASSPLSYPSVDNKLLCDSLDLPDDFRSDRHRDIFDELCRLLLGNWKPSAVKIPKKSTFGIPMMYIYEADYKREFALFAFENIDMILDLVAKREWITLAEKFGMVFCYNLNRRGQVDAPGKVRESNDLEYAKSGGRKGSRVNVDKTVVINGKVVEDFSAMRERVVQGASWAINVILQVMYTGHMYAMFEMYPETFHNTDPNTIAEDCKERGDATFSDVTQYDETMGKFLTHRFFDNMSKYWDERLVSMAKTLFYSPYYARPMRVSEPGEKQRGVFVGNPFKPDAFEVCSGNRSGYAGTSFIAKFMKVFDSLTVIDDMYKNVVNNVHSYLSHKESVVLYNNGDDEGCAGSPVAIALYREYRYDGKHGYFKVEPETGQGFSGSLIDWKRGIALPKIHTTFEKCYCPERSIGGNFRPRWPIGFVTRFDNLAKHEFGHHAEEIHRKAWRDKMYAKHGSFSDILAIAMEGLDLQFEGLTAIDKEVLDDEEKLYYKYTLEDLSPGIVDKIVVKLDPSEFLWAQTMFKGHVI